MLYLICLNSVTLDTITLKKYLMLKILNPLPTFKCLYYLTALHGFSLLKKNFQQSTGKLIASSIPKQWPASPTNLC